MSAPPRVVFDCNVYFQALAGRQGPAYACLNCAVRRDVELFCSEHTIAELQEVTARVPLRKKFGLTDERVDAFIQTVRSAASFVGSVPERYLLPADPDDSHYVNLALEAKARLIVSRDLDLLRLMDRAKAEGRDFHRRFPDLVILDPPTMLRLVADQRTE